MGYKTIKILPNRQLKCKNRLLGITGDKNATMLQFEPCFSEINGTSVELHEMRLVFNNAHGSYVRTPLEDHTFIIPQVLTVDTRLTLCIQFLLGDEVKWQSIDTEFIFAKGADDSNSHVMDVETAMTNLVAAFTALCGTGTITSDYYPEFEYEIPDFSEMTFEELLQFPETLRNLIGHAVIAVNTDTTAYESDTDTLVYLIHDLYDWVRGALEREQQSLEEYYRTVAGLPTDGSDDDDFLKGLQDTPVTSWDLLAHWGSQIRGRIPQIIEAEADEEDMVTLWAFYGNLSWED